MKLIGIILIIITLSGCSIHAPQSRYEFTSAVSKGEGFSKLHNLNVSKSFKFVVNNVNSKSKKCLSKIIQRSGHMMAPSSTTYNPSMKIINRNKAEFTLQVVHSPRGTVKVPSGDLYAIAVDFNKTSKNKTNVVIYAPSFGYDNIVNSIKSWSNGNFTTCPDLK